MSINEINEQAKESLRKYFKDGQDIQHDDDTKKQLTIEEMYKSVDNEIKEHEKKLEELHQMRHALQHNAKEAYEAIYGKEDECRRNGKRQSVHDTGRFLPARVSEYAGTGRRGFRPLYQ